MPPQARGRFFNDPARACPVRDHEAAPRHQRQIRQGAPNSTRDSETSAALVRLAAVHTALAEQHPVAQHQQQIQPDKDKKGYAASVSSLVIRSLGAKSRKALGHLLSSTSDPGADAGAVPAVVG